MASKSFCVKFKLDVHAVTCPGVWLCPNGDIALKIYTFNSTVETRKIYPIFPLLYHETFILKKVFTRVTTLSELQQCLEKEFLYTELIQWTRPLGQGIILATFETNLVDLLYPTPCFKELVAGVDVDLLMEPTKHFPGIIAPKIEVSTNTTIEEVFGLYDIDTNGLYVINPKTVLSKHTTCDLRKHPVKGIIRQRRVCHSREYGKARTQTNNTDCERLCAENSLKQPSKLCMHHQGHQCCDTTKKRSDCLCNSLENAVIHSPVCDNVHTFDSCPVCLKYKCYFPGHCNIWKCRAKSENSNHDENLFVDVSPQYTQDISTIDKELCCRQNNTLSLHSAITRPTNTSSALRRVKDLQNTNENLNYTADDTRVHNISDCCSAHCQEQSKHNFYKNLEKFYKRMYKQAKMKAQRTET